MVISTSVSGNRLQIKGAVINNELRTFNYTIPSGLTSAQRKRFIQRQVQEVKGLSGTRSSQVVNKTRASGEVETISVQQARLENVAEGSRQAAIREERGKQLSVARREANEKQEARLKLRRQLGGLTREEVLTKLERDDKTRREVLSRYEADKDKRERKRLESQRVNVIAEDTRVVNDTNKTLKELGQVSEEAPGLNVGQIVKDTLREQGQLLEPVKKSSRRDVQEGLIKAVNLPFKAVGTEIDPFGEQVIRGFSGQFLFPLSSPGLFSLSDDSIPAGIRFGGALGDIALSGAIDYGFKKGAAFLRGEEFENVKLIAPDNIASKSNVLIDDLGNIVVKTRTSPEGFKVSDPADLFTRSLSKTTPIEDTLTVSEFSKIGDSVIGVAGGVSRRGSDVRVVKSVFEGSEEFVKTSGAVIDLDPVKFLDDSTSLRLPDYSPGASGVIKDDLSKAQDIIFQSERQIKGSAVSESFGIKSREGGVFTDYTEETGFTLLKDGGFENIYDPRFDLDISIPKVSDVIEQRTSEEFITRGFVQDVSTPVKVNTRGVAGIQSYEDGFLVTTKSVESDLGITDLFQATTSSPNIKGLTLSEISITKSKKGFDPINGLSDLTELDFPSLYRSGSISRTSQRTGLGQAQKQALVSLSGSRAQAASEKFLQDAITDIKISQDTINPTRILGGAGLTGFDTRTSGRSKVDRSPVTRKPKSSSFSANNLEAAFNIPNIGVKSFSGVGSASVGKDLLKDFQTSIGRSRIRERTSPRGKERTRNDLTLSFKDAGIDVSGVKNIDLTLPTPKIRDLTSDFTIGKSKVSTDTTSTGIDNIIDFPTLNRLRKPAKGFKIPKFSFNFKFPESNKISANNLRRGESEFGLYVPSSAALIYDIRGDVKDQELFSGLGLRPLKRRRRSKKRKSKRKR